jgi:hypothetical protein
MDRLHIILGLKAASDIESVINRTFHGLSNVDKLSHIASKDILLRESQRTPGCMFIKQFLYYSLYFLEV